MTFQWWIDTIGKLGPGMIALLVLITTWSQNRWQNMISARAALVEDQKFRLALLERRTEAIDKVRFAISQFWTDGAFRQDAAAAAGGALQIAEFVFDDGERAAIEVLLRQIWKWQSCNRRVNAYQQRAGADNQVQLDAALDEMTAVETEMLAGFEPLVVRLRTAARVQSVPAVEYRKPTFRGKFPKA